jgi:long-subunit acyl-CoA synthetase (AMP-forming)
LRAQAARPRSLNLRLGTLAAGMESSTAIARNVQEVFCPTVSGYGMSEVLPFVAATRPSDTVEQRCEASGYPLTDIELRVIDPGSDVEQPAEVPGELLVRGYSVTLGYYKKPEATAELIGTEGWLHRRHGTNPYGRPRRVHGPLQGHAQDRRRERGAR